MFEKLYMKNTKLIHKTVKTGVQDKTYNNGNKLELIFPSYLHEIIFIIIYFWNDLSWFLYKNSSSTLVRLKKKQCWEKNLRWNVGNKILVEIIFDFYFRMRYFIKQDHPDLVKDQFWDEECPELPYTLASEDTRFRNVQKDSTAGVQVSS